MADLEQLDAFSDIPDPAERVAARTAPAPVLPPTSSLTRAGRRRRAALCAVFAVGWIGLCVGIWHPRTDIAEAGAILPIALWTLASAVALVFAVRPGRRGLPVGVRAIQVVLAAIPVLFVIPVLVVSGGVPDGSLGLRWHEGGECLTITSLMGVGPLLFASFALQGSFSSIPAARGAVVGILAGLFGAVGMHAVCSSHARGHLLVAHGAPILLLAVLGGLFGVLRGRP
jgi:hypothetical protein